MARKVVTAALLLLPWVLGRFGHSAGLAYVAAIVALFAALRALGETAWVPWVQEMVPDRVRGQFTAGATALGTLGSCLALVVAGQVIEGGTGTDRFLILVGVGSVFGVAGALAMVPVPGGAPRPAGAPREHHGANMRRALRDRNFVLYLGGLGCITLGSMMYLSFLPLFVKQRLGVPAGTVVTLETAVMVGGALSGLLWGWAADRVGSRPVIMVAAGLTLVVPVAWLLLPRQAPHMLLWCTLLYLAQGVATNGGAIGAARLVFTSVIPPQESTAYTAIYYAGQGLVGGAAPILAGALLQSLGLGERLLGPLTVDAYAVLLVLALVPLSVGWACYGRVRPDGRYRTRDVFHILSARLLQRLPW